MVTLEIKNEKRSGLSFFTLIGLVLILLDITLAIAYSSSSVFFDGDSSLSGLSERRG